jgi:hypothetical protein
MMNDRFVARSYKYGARIKEMTPASSLQTLVILIMGINVNWVNNHLSCLTHHETHCVLMLCLNIFIHYFN